MGGANRGKQAGDEDRGYRQQRYREPHPGRQRCEESGRAGQIRNKTRAARAPMTVPAEGNLQGAGHDLRTIRQRWAPSAMQRANSRRRCRSASDWALNKPRTPSPNARTANAPLSRAAMRIGANAVRARWASRVSIATGAEFRPGTASTLDRRAASVDVSPRELSRSSVILCAQSCCMGK